jgi:hypothetical protein
MVAGQEACSKDLKVFSRNRDMKMIVVKSFNYRHPKFHRLPIHKLIMLGIKHHYQIVTHL